MALGAANAGIPVLAAVEAHPRAARTYELNHSTTRVMCRDIRSVTASDLVIDRAKHSLIVFGGPPCRGFSSSNSRTRQIDNPDNWLFLEFARLVNELQPEWVVFENVFGLTDTARGAFKAEIIDQFLRQEYLTFDAVLNAADYGVPQNRRRYFLVCCRAGADFNFPLPQESHTTVRQAISDLPVLRNGNLGEWKLYRTPPSSAFARRLRNADNMCGNNLVTANSAKVLRRYRYVPEGGNWSDIPARLMKNYADRSRCHTGIYRRLRWDQPSIVIGNFRKNMLIHPSQNRGLSVREAARLQSFPDSYRFHGSIGFQQQQVGNAVPPLLAQAVFAQLLRAHERSQSAHKDETCPAIQPSARNRKKSGPGVE